MLREELIFVGTCDIAGLVRGKGFPASELPARRKTGIGWTHTNLMQTCFGQIFDPTKASCACTVTKGQTPYVVVTDTYSDTTCTTDMWSSATVAGVKEISDFLNKSDNIKPFDIKVLNPK